MQDLTAQQAPLEAHQQPPVQPPTQAHTLIDWDSFQLFPTLCSSLNDIIVGGGQLVAFRDYTGLQELQS